MKKYEFTSRKKFTMKIEKIPQYWRHAVLRNIDCEVQLNGSDYMIRKVYNSPWLRECKFYLQTPVEA